MTVNLERVLDRAKIAVFSDDNSAFLSVLLCSLQFSWKSDIPTAQTDGKVLQINPEWFITLPPKTQQFLILHELWHVARAHPIRGMDVENRKAWLFACDIVINNDLIRSGYTHESTSPIYDLKYPEGTSEDEIYEDIKDSFTDYPEEGWDDLVDPSTKDKQEILEIIVQAREVAKGSITKNLHTTLEEIIKDLLPPSVSWRTVLQDFVSLSDQTELSFSKINRRYPNIRLPGVTRTESLGKINYYLDVSGSVSTEDIRRFHSELFYLMQLYELESINIIQFDTQITKEELATINTLPTVYVGRGGTDLTCVKEHIEKTQPEFVIVFSDLECDPMQKLGYDVKLLWVIINNSDVIPPYGKYVHITT